MSGDKLKGVFCALAATAIWGGSYTVSRFLFHGGDEGFDGFGASFLRFAVSALVLAPALFDRQSWTTLRRDWRRDLPRFVFLALAGYVLEGTLVFFSTKFTTSARASLMANTTPIFTILISCLATRESIDGRKLCGMLLGAAGIALTFTSQGHDLFSGTEYDAIGALLAVSSGVCWALYTVFGAGVVQKYDPWFVSEILFIIATLAMPPAVLLCGGRISLSLNWQTWLGIAYWGVCVSAVACGLWYVALKHLSPGELGAFGYLTPVVSLVLAMIFFAERPSWHFYAALALIVGGVTLMVNNQPEGR